MLRLIISVISIFIWGILTLPVVGILYIIRNFNTHTAAKGAQAVCRVEARILLWLSGSRIDVQGLENIPDEPVVFISNHRGMFDIVMMYAYLKKETGFIAKIECKKMILISWWLTLMNGLYLDRKNIRQGMETILAAIDMVNDGVSVCIFPEGTRSKFDNATSVLSFHTGSFKVATKTGVPIVPIAVRGTGSIFENHFPTIRATDVMMHFGEPIYIDELNDETRKNLAEYVRGIILSMLAERNK